MAAGYEVGAARSQRIEVPGMRPPATGLGIYVHVPFCARRCGYCAFVTYSPGEMRTTAPHRRWTDAAVAEIAVADRELGGDRPPLTSVYFGGGTPTEVEPSSIGEVLGELHRRFEVRDDLEVSVEANPDGLRTGQLDALAALGVTRVSFGMQSAVAAVLRVLERTHDPDSVPRAVEAARRAGIASVSLDLIHGTPGESASDWDRTLDVALGLDPDHLSAYALSIEAGTVLAARVRTGALPTPSGDVAADRYETLEARASAGGLSWYELSNWARRPTDVCRHNLLYWAGGEWWGIGPGAHSSVAGRRWWNHADLRTWSELALTGRVPAAGSEEPSAEERRTERVMLGMRLATGIPIGWTAAGSVDGLVADGLVRRDADRVVLTRRGRLLADLVIRRLRWG